MRENGAETTKEIANVAFFDDDMEVRKAAARSLAHIGSVHEEEAQLSVDLIAQQLDDTDMMAQIRGLN